MCTNPNPNPNAPIFPYGAVPSPGKIPTPVDTANAYKSLSNTTLGLLGRTTLDTTILGQNRSAPSAVATRNTLGGN